MESLRLVQTGDLHLGSPFSFAPEKAVQLKRSQLDTFWSIIQLCLDRQAHVLMITGDLFDQPVPDKELVRQVCEMLASLENTKVLITPGNHDPLCLDSPYRTLNWPDSVKIFGSDLEYVELVPGQVRIYGVGFASTVTAQPLLSSLPEPLDPEYINLLLIHGDLYATSPQSPYNAVSPSQLAGFGFDYVAIGHVHQFSNFQKTGRSTMAYAGCPFGRGFDETGIKGVIAGSIQWMQRQISSELGPLLRPHSMAVNMAFVPLESRRFVDLEVDISTCPDQIAIADRILTTMADAQGERFRDDLYKIVLCGEVEEGSAPILMVLQQRLEGQVFFLKLRDQTRMKIDLALLAGEHSLRGAFIRQINSRIVQPVSEADGHSQAIARRALELGLKVMRGEDVFYAAD